MTGVQRDGVDGHAPSRVRVRRRDAPRRDPRDRGIVDRHVRTSRLAARHRQSGWNPNWQPVSPFRVQRSPTGRTAPPIPRRPRPGSRPRASHARRPVITSRVYPDRGPGHRDRAMRGGTSRGDPDLHVRDAEFQPGADQMDAAPSGRDLGGDVSDPARLLAGAATSAPTSTSACWPTAFRRQCCKSGSTSCGTTGQRTRWRRLLCRIMLEGLAAGSPVGYRAESVGGVHRRGPGHPELDRRRCRRRQSGPHPSGRASRIRSSRIRGHHRARYRGRGRESATARCSGSSVPRTNCSASIMGIVRREDGGGRAGSPSIKVVADREAGRTELDQHQRVGAVRR